MTLTSVSAAANAVNLTIMASSIRVPASASVAASSETSIQITSQIQQLQQARTLRATQAATGLNAKA